MLKIDVYVKTVLTVIAICLMVIAFRPVFGTPAEARGEVVDVNIVEIRGRRFGSLPVRVEEWNVIGPIWVVD